MNEYEIWLSTLRDNKYDLNGRSTQQENISNEPQIILNVR